MHTHAFGIGADEPEIEQLISKIVESLITTCYVNIQVVYMTRECFQRLTKKGAFLSVVGGCGLIQT